MTLIQTPSPGTRRLLFRGDIIEFRLQAEKNFKGRAYLRTNIGEAAVQREEIISSVETRRSRSGQDWHDIPMAPSGGGDFYVSIALLEVGHFEAKCFVIPENSVELFWPDGANTCINVESAGFCCANTVYCAFIRQFGANKTSKVSAMPGGADAAQLNRLDKAGYTVIPPSGTFRGFMKELDFIINTLKCRIIHLLPINPTPTVYARMGRYGSPYASLDFMSVDPALAEFDRKATPLDQFNELVDAVHLRNAKIFIDLAINHTGWAAKLHEEHPEWLEREADGSIRSPGAWGVTWGDLTELDHSRLDLWQYLSGVFLTWCARGVDGFRCDAGYMIPVPAWEYIIARVRKQYPDTVFLLEGLGGDPAVTVRLLNNADMNWAYSELFQNYTKEQIEGYVPYAQQISQSDGLMIHYAETHDNPRLAATSQAYAQMRTALSALASNNGAFGFTNGVEWFATEKIDVHEASALNWNSTTNQVPHIARLNSILITHPAFHNGSRLRFIGSGSRDCVAFVRCDSEGRNPLLVLINLNCSAVSNVSWTLADVPFSQDSLIDLITDEHFLPYPIQDSTFSMLLAAGQVLCLSPSLEDVRRIADAETKSAMPTDRIDRQTARSVALDIICWKNQSDIVFDTDAEHAASELLSDPAAFCKDVLAGGDDSAELPVVFWKWPQDVRRTVIVPPNHVLYLSAPHRFRASITDGDGSSIIIQRDSLRQDNKESHFVLFPPLPTPERHLTRKIRISVYPGKESSRDEGELLFLAEDCSSVSFFYGNSQIQGGDRTFLATNGRGGMLHVPLKWGELNCRYDALLAANLNPNYPEDRHVMWRRCRIWVKYHGRSVPVSIETAESFQLDPDGNGTWLFKIPVGKGFFVDLNITAFMVEGRNAVGLNIYRERAMRRRNYLDDEIPVTVVVRPDIEDRNFHQSTKAMNGPESSFPKALSAATKYFNFKPSSDRTLNISTLKGRFRQSTEWCYGVNQAKESARGLDPSTDVFSPGFFEIEFTGGECDQLIGQVITPWEDNKLSLNFCMRPIGHQEIPIDKILVEAMKKFIVRRDDYKTVIAGYPWFLDWGRDTLICTRGMIAAGMLDDVRKILLLFAKFAENGTLPNMIQGSNASNRDTSDAPLWLFTACSDFCAAENSRRILDEKIERKGTLLEELVAIAEAHLKGLPNGICVDKASGLVFSPPHFTWMDTNYPACTPREGYPIEIQALWFAALSFLAETTGDGKWLDLSEKVRHSINSLYPLKNLDWLADCLHAKPKTPAAEAAQGDALRPNQLLAITLGAVDDTKLCRNILAATQELLVPGGIRSLADRPVKFQLPILSNDGKLLNHPERPYWGRYEGDEDTRRKPAYHNGTAWTWQFPLYPEAYLATFGEQGRRTARAILSSASVVLDNGCAGQIPEILDGDRPHTQRGCDAQAWGVTELYRVWKLTR